ncbi:MFS general substrate transporter, partial [Rhizoclosmatium globosum]
LLLVCLFCVCVLAALDNLIVSTAIRSIVIDIGKQELAPWIGSAYMITSAGLTPLYGRFADIFGRKPMLLFAIVLFEIGSLVCAVAQSMETLIVAGIGGGGLGSLVLIIMSEIVTIRERAKYQGMLGAAIGLSSIMGPLVGGLLCDNATWRWCFWINIPFGVLVIGILSMVRFPVVSSDKSLLERLRQLDWLGVITLFLAIMFFVTPLQLGGSLWEWNSAPVLTMLPLSVVLIALFVWIEKRARNPIIPSSLFVHSNTALLLVYSLALGAIFFSGAYYISLFFQIVFGKSASDAGVTALPLSFGMVSATVGSGIVVSKRGRYISLFYAGPVFMIIGCALTSFLDANSPLIQQIGVMFIFGFGGGLVYQTRVVAMQLSVKTELIAVATSVSTTCFLLGGAVGISITGTIINN